MLNNVLNIPPGVVLQYVSTTIPAGWLECDGSAVSRTTYAALFSIIGTTFGAGDGSTTFNLPDARGRAPLGRGTGSGLTARSLAGSGGAETHTLSTSEMPAHRHTIGGGSDFSIWCAENNAATNLQNLAGGNFGNVRLMDNAGGGGSHNNMQPWLALTFIIKT